MTNQPVPGAVYLGENTCVFSVWAPFVQDVAVRLLPPIDRIVPLSRRDRGYHTVTVTGVPAGTRYLYVLDGSIERPDPASRYQPEGVHGPSEVCFAGFEWTDQSWRGIPLHEYVLYELHVGTFTDEGTFDAIIPRLTRLRDLGITAVELMPVSQFPGDRNWGYDGSYTYAVQNSYGGPEALKRLVDACHTIGIAVVLDVVYNHFGPEGNYAAEFGPYFTDRYQTPWGRAMNFDGPGSDDVRRYFIENALYWLRDLHFDALRLDALHAILDTSARPFLAELVDAVESERSRTGRSMYLIGESDLNDPRLLRRREQGGIALDAQWNDDFHHALHVLLTGEQTGYYADYGRMCHMAQTFGDGFAYSGQYSSYRQRRHGDTSNDIPPERFVVFSQNHDQVGNRLRGDRLSSLVSYESLKLAAACVILSPHVPLLFMGEEYGEKAPFPYFVSHSDEDLIEAVRTGRASEFKSFQWEEEPPDPQSIDAFMSAKLDWRPTGNEEQETLWRFYRELISLRRASATLMPSGQVRTTVSTLNDDTVLLAVRSCGDEETALLLNFAEGDATAMPGLRAGRWSRCVDSADHVWLGEGSKLPEQFVCDGQEQLHLGPRSAVLLSREMES